jgi:hypothetical protein
MPVCPTGSIYSTEEVPEDYQRFVEMNAARFN